MNFKMMNENTDIYAEIFYSYACSGHFNIDFNFNDIPSCK